MSTIDVTVKMLIHINIRPNAIACLHFTDNSTMHTLVAIADQSRRLRPQPSDQLDEWTITVLRHSELDYWKFVDIRSISLSFLSFSLPFRSCLMHFFGHGWCIILAHRLNENKKTHHHQIACYFNRSSQIGLTLYRLYALMCVLGMF